MTEAETFYQCGTAATMCVGGVVTCPTKVERSINRSRTKCNCAEYLLGINVRRLLPRKHKTFVDHFYNVGPTSTLYKCYTNVLCLLGNVLSESDNQSNDDNKRDI